MELKGSNSQIVEEASHWLIECRTGQLDKVRRREFMHWLKRSPEHVRVYIEISEAYAGLPDAKLLPANALDRLIEHTRSRMTAEHNVLNIDRGTVGDESVRLRSMHFTVERFRLMGVAAALVLTVAALVSWPLVSRGVYVTDIGEQRSIDLDDGSRVELNGRSKIRVHLSSAARRIELLQGEALFQVAKDERRPFIVTSDEAQVRALGTKFDIDRRSTRTIVSVVEGRVALSTKSIETRPTGGHQHAEQGAAEASSSISPLLIAAGEQVVVTADSASKATGTNAAAAMAWTHGEVEFDGTPLPEVADEFNRHNRRRLMIEGSGLRDIRITCVYSLDDSDSLIRFLQSQPDLNVTITNDEIRISKK